MGALFAGSALDAAIHTRSIRPLHGGCAVRIDTSRQRPGCHRSYCGGRYSFSSPKRSLYTLRVTAKRMSNVKRTGTAVGLGAVGSFEPLQVLWPTLRPVREGRSVDKESRCIKQDAVDRERR